jgi:hypothetical protein
MSPFSPLYKKKNKTEEVTAVNKTGQGKVNTEDGL